MHGNVYEWCEDWYGEYQGGAAADPKGAGTGTAHVARGGSWRCPASYSRAATRVQGGNETWFDGGFGFRVVVGWGGSSSP